MERFFCAEAARVRGDPIVGTAPHGVVWILIEYRGGWPAAGFDGLDLDPVTKALVFSAARAVRARVLLIRRHGRRRPGGRNRWAVLRHESSGAHRQQWGTWSRDEELAEIVAALGAPGRLGLPPVVLVCAHGLHDTCCAVRGRPVGRALSERWPDLVWECTHVGGDRFAANVVVAPDGVYYGGLDAESSVAVVEDHLADRIRAEHLRGYTDLFPPQQAAVAAVLGRFGPAGRHDYTVAGTSRDLNHWRIHVTSTPPRPTALDIEVRAHRTPARQLTCRGPAISSALVHEVTSIRTV
ncbi:sucrase ferredoxin [Streptomyces tsukubensis]|uniref:Sucrase ferredoxin n=1 Tax=Streptomyces tsukubensis TaxID=83656 RepID=A0A1V3ZZP1_9ACTN|nr:sucrase ferredoxin [Streptomyces tsukubensis]OON71476.1 sucrase ferredoxin [Streptomyces tsukubensis]QFR96987.1 sucrase ferredoxin [Streptomyces tsukubensis]